jgi:hypothetical protein
MQNGTPPGPQIPESCRTNFYAGGAAWQVDEEPEDVVDMIVAFLLGNERALKLTADHRPIWFSRILLESWSVAWPIKRVAVKAASPQEARLLEMSQRQGR